MSRLISAYKTVAVCTGSVIAGGNLMSTFIPNNTKLGNPFTFKDSRSHSNGHASGHSGCTYITPQPISVIQQTAYAVVLFGVYSVASVVKGALYGMAWPLLPFDIYSEYHDRCGHMNKYLNIGYADSEYCYKVNRHQDK